MTDAEFKVLTRLFKRYRKMIIENGNRLTGLPNKCNVEHLTALCDHALEKGQLYPYDKMCRWLGFVQGVLAVRGITDVDVERDYTRPLFHALYGRAVPTF